MPASSRNSRNSEGQGRRAEEVAAWYFRLNGFLQIPAFVLHSDKERQAITDADVLGVRFPHSGEAMREIGMTDDRWIVTATRSEQILFTIVEVKKPTCAVNKRWRDKKGGAMEKVIKRIGFAPEDLIPQIAKSLYDTLQWQNDKFLVQYVAVGKKPNHNLAERFPKLKQLSWSEIAEFIFERFRTFGHLKGSHAQWPCFAQLFARAFLDGRLKHIGQASLFVEDYIENGTKKQVENGS